ncbi:MAG: zinc ribbon domain-containing protein [Anaerolineae bacterium]
MPLYTYRREDGTTFDIQQKFLDDPLTVDPTTGQKVVRVVQAAGIIFKGSGFYVNDSKSGSRNSATAPIKSKDGEASTTADTKPTTTSETSAPKTEAAAPKTESKPAAD